MVELLISVGGTLLTKGLDLLTTHLDKKKKAQAAQVTLEQLNQKLADLQAKTEALTARAIALLPTK